MKGGKTRIQRAMVLASGKLKFVKNISHRGGSSHHAAKTSHKSHGGLRSTTGKKGFHRRGGLNIERAAFKVASAGALILPIVQKGHDTGRWDWAIGDLGGYNFSTQKFDFGLLQRAWMPFVGVNLAYLGYKAGKRLLRGLF